MSDKDEEIENPPAFPVHPDVRNKKLSGMTLRDYLAGKVISSIIGPGPVDDGWLKEASRRAYLTADVMLKERIKTK